MLVEIVGPGGSGKSTVVAELESDHALTVLRVGAARNLGARARAAATALVLAIQYQLRPAQALSLFRKCCSVETGLCLIGRAPSGLVFVDEGPVRTLRDTRCRSYRERAAWWAYAKQVLMRLSRLNRPMLIVELRLDEEVRRQRYGARTSAELEAGRGTVRRFVDHATRRRSPALIPTARRGVTVFAGRHLSPMMKLEAVKVSGAETPSDIAARIMGVAANAASECRPDRVSDA